MSVLNYKTKPAKNGKAEKLLVFLHGYGADGNDLLGLADPLTPHLPNTAFAAPDAPDRSTMNPMGFQWFPIPWIDGSTEEQSREGVLASAEKLSDWLDHVMDEFKVTAQDTVLLGFSQGCMMSLHHGLRRNDTLAGIVGISGRLLMPELLKTELTSKPPVMLIHGDRDDVVPPSSMPQAQEALLEHGIEVSTYVSEGTAHGISGDGLGIALQFMIERAQLT